MSCDSAVVYPIKHMHVFVLCLLSSYYRIGLRWLIYPYYSGLVIQCHWAVNEATLKDIGKNDRFQTTAKHSNVRTVCRIRVMYFTCMWFFIFTLQWRHNGRDGVSNHQPQQCLLNRLFRRRSKKTSKLCVMGLCAGNSRVTGEFPIRMTSNAENVSIWWRHHDIHMLLTRIFYPKMPKLETGFDQGFGHDTRV